MAILKSYSISNVDKNIIILCYSKHNDDVLLVSKTYLFCSGVDQTYVYVLFLTDSCDKMSKKCD